MRTFVAPILLAGVFSFAGLGVLHALRPFGRSPLHLLAALGLAYLVGVSVLGLIVIALLVAGVTPTLLTFTMVTLAVGVAGGLIGLRTAGRHPTAAPPPMLRADRIAIIAVAVLFGLFSIAALTQYTSAPMWNWDSWAIFGSKGLALLSFGALDERFFAGTPYTFIHQDYPLLIPVVEMLHYRAIGRADTQSVHVQFWFMLVAFPWALGYLASRTGRAIVWAPIALGAVAAPAIVTVMIGGLADVPVAIWVACGVLAMGIWVESGRRADLAVATILLAGAASIKNEGILAAAIALIVAAMVLVPERPRLRLRQLGIAATAFIIAILPWQVWAAGHGVPKDVKLGDALSPAYMVGHADRIPPTITELLRQLTDENRWSYFLPLALVAGIVAIVVRHARRAAAFYLLTAVGAFSALVWAYWTSPYPVDWYLTTSGFRVVGIVAGVSMAALVHLSGRLASLGSLGAAAPDGEVQPAEEPAKLQASDEPALTRHEGAPADLLAFWRT
jgi:hypothetical protein